MIFSGRGSHHLGSDFTTAAGEKDAKKSSNIRDPISVSRARARASKLLAVSRDLNYWLTPIVVSGTRCTTNKKANSPAVYRGS